MNKADAGLATNRSCAKAGFILGLFSIAISIVIVVIVMNIRLATVGPRTGY